MGTRIDPALVALRLPAGPAFVTALEDAWSRGDAVLPVPPELPASQTRRWFAALRPHRVVDASGTSHVEDGQPVRPGTALVVATSGSTGAPKGVVLSHAALRASTDASLERLGAKAGIDRWLCCLPLSHVAGLQVLLRARRLGTEPVVHERFDPRLVGREPEGLFVSLVPTMLARLLDAGVDLGRFARILLGGAPAPAPLLAEARAAGARVVTSYGMSETCGGCVYEGVPLRGVDVRIGDDSDGSVGGPTGRIRLRGPVLFDGYRGTGAARHSGWFDTADVGTWDADGRLRVLGRADDVIMTGGEKVAPAEVAALLAEHPAVTEAAVVGSPDPEWGQRVVAYVTVTDPARPPTLDDVRAFFAQRAARHTVPRQLVVVETLPRTRLGKVDTRRLGD